MLMLCEQVYPVLVGDVLYPYERRVGALTPSRFRSSFIVLLAATLWNVVAGLSVSYYTTVFYILQYVLLYGHAKLTDIQIVQLKHVKPAIELSRNEKASVIADLIRNLLTTTAFIFSTSRC